MQRGPSAVSLRGQSLQRPIHRLPEGGGQILMTHEDCGALRCEVQRLPGGIADAPPVEAGVGDQRQRCPRTCGGNSGRASWPSSLLVDKIRAPLQSPCRQPEPRLILAHLKSACSRVLMPSVTVRNLPSEIHRALAARARRHGRSLEAELRVILEDAARSPDRLRLGSFLARLGQDLALSEEEWAAFAQSRDGSFARSTAIE